MHADDERRGAAAPAAPAPGHVAAESGARPPRLPLTRRQALGGAGAMVALAAVGCGAPREARAHDGGRGEPWADGTYWDDGTGWV